MSLWGNIDTANSAPKFLIDSTLVTAANTTNDYGGLAPQVDLRNAYFVDTREATVATNRANGIKTPGWTLFKTYGSGRKYVETLVSIRSSNTAAGDLGISGTGDDSVVIDN